MRTTLTIDNDVAVVLERLRKSRDASLKELINEALRLGLKEMSPRVKRRDPFQTNSADLGQMLINIDNAAEALAIVEGDAFK